MQEWFYNNDISMYSTYNEGKSAITQKAYKNIKN